MVSKQPIYATSLKVIRRNAAAEQKAAQAPLVIGGSADQEPSRLTSATGHVRKRKEEILRKVNQAARRNTVAVNSVDLDRSLLDEAVGYETVGAARSSNCMDRIGVPGVSAFKQFDTNGTSMPGIIYK